MENFTIPKDAERQFEERGYFVVRQIIDADAVRAVRDELVRIIAEDAPGFRLDRSRADGVHEEIPRDLVAGITPESVPLHAGDAVVWHEKMWHMSPPNPSDRPRWGGVMVTMPAEMAEGAGQADRPFLIADGKMCDRPKISKK